MPDPSPDLRALYPPPGERAVKKQLSELDRHCQRFIALSPFVVLATCDAGGRLDASPRGGAPGFVQVPDPATLLLPDASGNNRIDSLHNITATGRAGLLFLIPGIDETLRVNGRAALTTEPAVLARFDALARPPRVVLRVTVEEAYLHCAKAFMRSRLWDPASRLPRSTLPTFGEMLADQIGSTTPPESQAAMLARYATEL